MSVTQSAFSIFLNTIPSLPTVSVEKQLGGSAKKILMQASTEAFSSETLADAQQSAPRFIPTYGLGTRTIHPMNSNR